MIFNISIMGLTIWVNLTIQYPWAELQIIKKSIQKITNEIILKLFRKSVIPRTISIYFNCYRTIFISL